MILIGLGSSLGFWGRRPPEIIACAVHALSSLGKIEAVSGLYRSPAWPDPSEPEFFNACARMRSDLGPEAILSALHAIEAAFGRRRGRPNAPRTLDLDLLDYQSVRGGPAAAPGVDLPHPRLETRDFVLLPLREVAPDWRHPALGATAADLIAQLPTISATPTEWAGGGRFPV